MSEPTFMHLIVEYLSATIAYWWLIVPGALMPLPEIFKALHPRGKDFPVPWWMRMTILFGCFTVAQFLAYRDVRRNVSQVIEEKRQFSVRINELEEQVRILRSTTEDEKKQKRIHIKTELTKLLDHNTKIQENCQRDKPPMGFSCWNEWIHWRDQTRNYISKNMDPSYLARFKATTGTSMAYKRTPSGSFLQGKESDAVNLLTFSAGTLDQFIREFPN